MNQVYSPGGTRQGAASTTKINSPGGTRQGAASTTRINLEEPILSGYPAPTGLTWRNPSGWPAQPGKIRSSVSPSVSLCVRAKRGDRVKEY
jgi:hypothetical protein